MTAELVQTISVEDAQRLTERIRIITTSVRDQVEKLAGLIAEARDREAWAALGYRSWTEYVAAEFADSPLRLDRDDRRELVVSLAQQGMPTRAIAPVVGASKSQVADDLSTVQDRTVEDAPAPLPPTIGRDGRVRQRPAPRPVREPEPADEVVEAELVAEDEEAAPPARPDRAPRIDVPSTVARALLRAREAADAAQKITRQHLAGRNNEAAVWSRDLATSMQALQRLLDDLEGVK